MNDQFKKAIPAILKWGYGAPAVIIGGLSFLYLLIFWLPAYFAPEQCHEYPAFGMMVKESIITILLIGTIISVGFLLVEYIGSRPDKPMSDEELREWLKKQKVKSVRNKKIAKIAEKALYALVFLFLLGFLITMILKTYYCW